MIHCHQLQTNLTITFSIHCIKSISTGRQKNRKVLVSAAPQCPFPDKLLGRALKTAPFDSIWVQFYNNPQCQFDSTTNSSDKLLESWRNWTSPSNGVRAKKIFLGLPAMTNAAMSGYIRPDVLISDVLPKIKSSDNYKYGGVMLWSKYWDELNENYSKTIYNATLLC